MSMVTLRQYFAAAGSRYSADDAHVIGPELERLAGSDQPGTLPPGEIVRAATDPASPLHRYFDWDDALAGRKWRVAQANDMKAKILIVPVGGEPPSVALPGPRGIPVTRSQNPAASRGVAAALPAPAVAASVSPRASPSLKPGPADLPGTAGEELVLAHAALAPLLEWDRIYQPLAKETPGFRRVFSVVFEAIEKVDVMISRLDCQS